MNVVIVDDDKLVTTSLKLILESDEQITVCASGSDGTEAVSLYRNYHPDVLLMDIRMNGLGGIDAARQILQEDANANILFLTTFLDDQYIIDALQIGAKGYLLKQDYDTIIPSLKAVYSGQSVFGREIISRIPSYIHSSPKTCFEDFDITDKEYAIIELIAAGMGNKEIAAKLNLSEGTIRNYLSVILEKLHLNNRTQVAIFFYKQTGKNF